MAEVDEERRAGLEGGGRWECDAFGSAILFRISRYFRVVGVRGAVKLDFVLAHSFLIQWSAHVSNLLGRSSLYASKTFLLTFLMSAFASLAVARIIASISLARASFSRSGGLKQFMQASVDSTTASRNETDLSATSCNK